MIRRELFHSPITKFTNLPASVSTYSYSIMDKHCIKDQRLQMCSGSFFLLSQGLYKGNYSHSTLSRFFPLYWIIPVNIQICFTQNSLNSTLSLSCCLILLLPITIKYFKKVVCLHYYNHSLTFLSLFFFIH